MYTKQHFRYIQLVCVHTMYTNCICMHQNRYYVHTHKSCTQGVHFIIPAFCLPFKIIKLNLRPNQNSYARNRIFR